MKGIITKIMAADSYMNWVTGEGGEFGAGGDLGSIVTKIINVAMGVLGVVCVIMLIVGGYNYTMSGGDATKVTKAKNTILYAVIGLVIALLALAIVNFVLTNI